MGSDPTKTGSSTPSKSWGEWLWGGAVYAGTKVDQAAGVAGVFALTGGTVVDMDQASASKLLTEAGSGYRKGAAVINDALTFGHLDHERSIQAQEEAKKSKDVVSQIGYGAGKVGAHAAQSAIAGVALEAAIPATGTVGMAGKAAGAVATPLTGATAYFKGKTAYYNIKNGDITEGVDNAGGALVDGIFAADAAMNTAKSLSKSGAATQAAQETGVASGAVDGSNGGAGAGAGAAEQAAQKAGVAPKTQTGYGHLTDPPTVGAGNDFSAAQKAEIIAANKARNGGVVKSDQSGEVLTPPAKSQKGVTPSSNEWQIDHIVPKDKNGTNSFGNAQVLSRAENRAKWNK